MRGRGIEFIGIVRGPGDPVPRSVRPSLRMRWYHSAVQSSPRILAMFRLETWCRVIYRVRITVMIDVTTHIVAPMSQIAYIDAQLSDLSRYDSEFQALRKDNVVALTAVPIPRSPRDSDKRYNNVNSLTFRTFGAPVEVIFSSYGTVLHHDSKMQMQTSPGCWGSRSVRSTRVDTMRECGMS